jgi:pimeloyl-ACP methyl ester carboxylesterase
MNTARGEALVLLPGLKSDARLWTPQIEAFGRDHPIQVPVDALDADRIDAMATAALAACPPRFALAGASMGGYVALAMMRAAPERISRLALIATSARPDSSQATQQRELALADARRHGLRAMARASLARDFHRHVPPDDPLALTMVAMAEATGIERLARQVRACASRPDARPELAHIGVPVLVIVGDQDQVIAPEAAAEICAAVAQAVRVQVRDAGHNLTLEQPDAVNDTLARWLAGGAVERADS